jgi:hypothetical protein
MVERRVSWKQLPNWLRVPHAVANYRFTREKVGSADTVTTVAGMPRGARGHGRNAMNPEL